MQSAIEIDGLRKAYGDVEAVRDISFSVAAGEVFCLLGPNGAGKTTTTEILEGYRARSAGEVRVLGHDPEDGERALRERVGIVLQEAAAQAELTVAEVLTMYGRYYPRRRPAGELVELVGLAGKESQRVKLLSGGQRRRLDLALALVGDPDLLFLDEPTTGFDPSARRQAWTTIKDLCALGKTVFLTTHFMDEAQALADRVAVMVDGRIVALGTPGRDRRPRHRADRDRLRAPRRVEPARPAGARRRRGHRAGTPAACASSPARGCAPPTRSRAGRSSAATSCAASPSASPRWRTSTFD